MKHNLYFIAAGHMSVDLATGALPAILPFLVAARGMSYTQVAGLVFASAVVSAVFQPFFGWLADRIPNRWFMGAGIAIACLSISTLAFLDDYVSIFCAIAIMGIGSSMFHPEAARFVNLISGNHRGEGMAIFSVGGNAGFAVGPIIAVAALSLVGFHGLIIFAAIGLGMGLATLMLVPRLLKSIGSARKTSTRSKAVSASNDWAAFRVLTVILMVRSTVFNGMMAFLPLFCIQKLAISTEMGSSLVTAYAVGGILMTMLGGRMADRFDLVSVIRVCTACYVPALLLIIFAPSFWLIVLLMLPVTFATHGSYSPFVVLGQTYLAKSIGFASGVTLGLSVSLGGVLMPVLGFFADSLGLEAAMYLLVLLGLCATLAAFQLPRPKIS